MSHRGPDGFGTWESEQIILHHTRLAIIDLSDSASQPMSEGDKIAISFNGEIYNFKELRSSLEKKNYKFSSDSDTEVILKLFLEYGIEFIQELRGMFAIALYDARDESHGPKLFLIRDHFGMKPLLYSLQGSGLVFGSEIKSLLSSGLVSKEIDDYSLRELLAVGCIYQPKTILKEIRSVNSGSYLEIDNYGIREKRWWDPNSQRLDFSAATDLELINLGEKYINDSIKAHLTADLPVSVLLSGGLDSSLLTAMTARLGGKPLDTFTVGFQSDREIDERINAKQIASLNGTNHHEITLSDEEIEETLFSFIKAIDQPTMDGFNSFLVSRSVSFYSKVTISGTGGDELFAGYPWFRETQEYVGRYQSGLMSYVSRRSNTVIENLPILFHRYAFRGKVGHFYKQNQAFGFEKSGKLLGSKHYSMADFKKSFLDFNSRDLLKDDDELTRLSFLCLDGYAKNQLLRDIDASSMNHSLEIRLPFLDINVFRFSSSLPDRLKLRPSMNSSGSLSYAQSGEKFILGEISKRYLPLDFLNRKKQGFHLPLDEWLRGPLSSLVDSKLMKNSSTNSLGISAQELNKTVEEFKRGTLPAIKIWLLLVLVLWFEHLESRES
jgi:asparagine synthase (glutamine-hydrolysing)